MSTPLDADRERELRELAVRLLGSRRHGRVGRALAGLLLELDVTRGKLLAVLAHLDAADQQLARERSDSS